MKSMITACMWFVCLSAIAQTASSEPIPITKDSALHLRTIQEVFGLPPSTTISGGTVAVISRKDNVTEPWKPAKGMADPIIRELIQQARYGDRLVFEGFTATDGDKRTKLDKKSFRFK